MHGSARHVKVSHDISASRDEHDMKLIQPSTRVLLWLALQQKQHLRILLHRYPQLIALPARSTHAGQLTDRLCNRIKHIFGEAGMHLHNRIRFGILPARHQTLLLLSFIHRFVAPMAPGVLKKHSATVSFPTVFGLGMHRHAASLALRLRPRPIPIWGLGV